NLSKLDEEVISSQKRIIFNENGDISSVIKNEENVKPESIKKKKLESDLVKFEKSHSILSGSKRKIKKPLPRKR
ncbi:MAG: hypothetical protein MHPSP_004698, partial [Paramarteilia canceri]